MAVHRDKIGQRALPYVRGVLGGFSGADGKVSRQDRLVLVGDQILHRLRGGGLYLPAVFLVAVSPVCPHAVGGHIAQVVRGVGGKIRPLQFLRGIGPAQRGQIVGVGEARDPLRDEGVGFVQGGHFGGDGPGDVIQGGNGLHLAGLAQAQCRARLPRL